MKYLKKFENLVWEFSVEEVTNILQDFMDEGWDIRINKSFEAICIHVHIPMKVIQSGINYNALNYFQKDYVPEMQRKVRSIKNRLIEFGFDKKNICGDSGQKLKHECYNVQNQSYYCTIFLLDKSYF